jgi:hypothetical protein
VTTESDRLFPERASTILPAAYFDELVSSLDKADDAPGLARAARDANERKRIRAPLGQISDHTRRDIGDGAIAAQDALFENRVADKGAELGRKRRDPPPG